MEEMQYEESKMPEHHRLLIDKLLIKDDESGIPSLGIYGTSTILQNLFLDGLISMDLEIQIEKISDQIRDIFRKILEKDDNMEQGGKEHYLTNTLFNLRICGVGSEFLASVLLPPTVSKDTFNTFYDSFIQLADTHSDYKMRISEKEVESTNSIWKSVFMKKVITYTDVCYDYIKAIKRYLYSILDFKDNDYIINSYRGLLVLLKSENYELYKIREDDVVGKMCYDYIKDIKKQYKMFYKFEEVIDDDGLRYKIIPKGFLLYRGYPNSATPFSRSTSYLCLGFSFLDTVNYGRPNEKNFQGKEVNSYNYCRLLGNVVTMEVNDDLKLLDLGDLDTVKLLKTKMSGVVLEKFEKAWSIKNDTIQRKSVYSDDAIVYDWLENFYQGYIGYGVPGLHDEICCFTPPDLKHKQEERKGWGERFPSFKIRNIFPLKDTIPMCKEPFNKLNYKIFVDNV
jgi:hypothetical protein